MSRALPSLTGALSRRTYIQMMQAAVTQPTRRNHAASACTAVEYARFGANHFCACSRLMPFRAA